jgi:DNA-binding transcriptional LysR family regulator
MMTLKQLETFYWVYRLGSFVKAAERLHSTQSAVSMRIHDLETSLGVLLFDRSQRATQITPKGQELLKYAEQMIGLASEARQRVSDPSVLSVTFRLGVTELVAVTWLSDLVTAIDKKHPRVTVELNVDLTLNQLRKLENGNIDMALLPGPIETPGLANVSLGTVEFVWVASPKLHVPHTELQPRDLGKWPLLTLTHESNLHNMLGMWFDRPDSWGQRVDVCNSIGVLTALAIAGLGVAYLPRQQCEPQIADETLQVLNTTPTLPDLEYFAVFQKRKSQPLAATFANLAQQYSSFVKTK